MSDYKSEFKRRASIIEGKYSYKGSKTGTVTMANYLERLEKFEKAMKPLNEDLTKMSNEILAEHGSENVESIKKMCVEVIRKVQKSYLGGS